MFTNSGDFDFEWTYFNGGKMGWKGRWSRKREERERAVKGRGKRKGKGMEGRSIGKYVWVYKIRI